MAVEDVATSRSGWALSSVGRQLFVVTRHPLLIT